MLSQICLGRIALQDSPRTASSGTSTRKPSSSKELIRRSENGYTDMTGRVAIYYGCADTVTGLAFGYIPEIIEFTKRTNIL